ncbi:hypothetical protein [Phytohabitans aurantiacus]|uniref:Uncharacterized protein n=1 Tax=Phytohabitans aurantiacus TaxID=3016789 RepID=A0ABQ5R9P3_9ACTN|nr:hypothetical protein [Phytohabitans aurantiacus]GLI02928.1 hypothetical protein Pa4123_82060 [Phytohabitans aurantiacus]
MAARRTRRTPLPAALPERPTPWYRSTIVKWAAGFLTALAVGVLIAVIEHRFVTDAPPQAAPTSPPAATASSGAPSPSGGASSPAGEVPLTVVVTASGHPCAGGWLIGKPPAEIPAPAVGGNDPTGWDGWATGAGAVRAGTQFVRLDLQGVGEAEVVIHDIRPVVAARSRPASGTLAKAACGGDKIYRYVNVDLDRSPPARSYELDEDWVDFVPPQERWPIKFPYGVSLKESESILVIGNTEQNDIRWRIEIDWTSRGGKALTSPTWPDSRSE